MAENVSSSSRAVPSWAILFLRIAVGVVFVMHGSQKVFGAFGGHGMEGVIGMVTSLGFPAPVMFAWMLALTEFLGGLAVFFGLFTRPAAFAIAVNMTVAIIKVHFKNGFFAPTGFEYPFTLLLACISLMFSGPGRISLDWLIRRMLGTTSKLVGCILGDDPM